MERAQGFTREEQEQIRKRTSKSLLWVGIASIIMIFIGLTSAYIVRQEEGQWVVFDLPTQFSVSTVFIVLSSVTMFWATYSARRNNFSGVKIGLFLTLVLGLGFAYSQWDAWNFMHDQGIFFAGKASHSSGSYLYVISGLHLAHLLVGILSLIYTFARSLQGAYRAGHTLGIELSALYWHFLDILWVYLFLFLLYIR